MERIGYLVQGKITLIDIYEKEIKEINETKIIYLGDSIEAMGDDVYIKFDCYPSAIPFDKKALRLLDEDFIDYLSKLAEQEAIQEAEDEASERQARENEEREVKDEMVFRPISSFTALNNPIVQTVFVEAPQIALATMRFAQEAPSTKDDSNHWAIVPNPEGGYYLRNSHVRLFQIFALAKEGKLSDKASLEHFEILGVTRGDADLGVINHALVQSPLNTKAVYAPTLAAKVVDTLNTLSTPESEVKGGMLKEILGIDLAQNLSQGELNRLNTLKTLDSRDPAFWEQMQTLATKVYDEVLPTSDLGLTPEQDSGHSDTDYLTNVSKPIFYIDLPSDASEGDTLEIINQDKVVHSHSLSKAEMQLGKLELGLDLPDGEYRLHTLMHDAHGHSTQPNQTLLLEIDSIFDPKAKMAIDFAPGHDTGASASDGLSNKNNPAFMLHNIPDDVYYATMQIGNDLLQETWQGTGAGAGKFYQTIADLTAGIETYRLDFAPRYLGETEGRLDDGIYKIVFHIEDRAGNSREIVKTVEIDTQINAVSVKSVEKGVFALGEVEPDVIEIEVTALDKDGKLKEIAGTLTLEAGKMVSSDSAFVTFDADKGEITVKNIDNFKVENIQIIATDKAGNVSGTSDTVILDPLVKHATRRDNDKNPTLAIDLQGQTDLLKIVVFEAGKEIATLRRTSSADDWPDDHALLRVVEGKALFSPRLDQDQTYAYGVAFEDHNNQTAKPTAFSYTLDSTADADGDLGFVDHPDTVNAKQAKTYAFGLTGIDDDIEKVTVTFSDEAKHQETLEVHKDPYTPWEEQRFAHDLSTLGDGSITVHAHVTDALNNKATSQYTLHKDSIADLGKDLLIYQANENFVDLQGYDGTGTLSLYRVDDQGKETEISATLYHHNHSPNHPYDGHYFSLDAPLPQGQESHLVVKVVDALGNQATSPQHSLYVGTFGDDEVINGHAYDSVDLHLGEDTLLYEYLGNDTTIDLSRLTGVEHVKIVAAQNGRLTDAQGNALGLDDLGLDKKSMYLVINDSQGVDNDQNASLVLDEEAFAAATVKRVEHDDHVYDQYRYDDAHYIEIDINIDKTWE